MAVDTIFAVATASGRSGVAVVRVSGPRADDALARFSIEPPEPRRAVVRALVHEGDLIDRALVLRFAAGASFTGEPVVELHLHGSPAIIRKTIDILGSLPDFRMAEAGEFTRRALENGKMDLAEIEGLGDLLEAETEAQRRQAMRVFDGAFGRKIETWRSDLLWSVAQLGALIDFSDEDVPDAVDDEVLVRLERLERDFLAQASGQDRAERVRSGFVVAIVGAPNVGKSTLLNRIAGRDAALTSSRAGTTRDVIELRYDLNGLAVTFLDTAGVRDAEDEIEAEGVARTKTRAASADLRIFLGGVPEGMVPEPGDQVVGAKSDLRSGDSGDGLWVSGVTGEGVDRMLDEIYKTLSVRADGASLAIRARHRIALEQASRHVGVCLDELRGDGALEIAADSLHAAMRALDQILGRIGVEDVLGEIFASFCIGK